LFPDRNILGRKERKTQAPAGLLKADILLSGQLNFKQQPKL